MADYSEHEGADKVTNKCCFIALILINVLMTLVGLAVSIVSALSLWGPQDIKSAFDVALFLKSFDAASYTLFALGLLTLLTSMLGYVIATCFKNGNPVYCVAILYYLFLILLFITSLALMVFGIIISVDKALLGIERAGCPGTKGWTTQQYVYCNNNLNQGPDCIPAECLFDRAAVALIDPSANRIYQTNNLTAPVCFPENDVWCNLQNSLKSCGWYCASNSSLPVNGSCVNTTDYVWQATGSSCSTANAQNTRQAVISLLDQISVALAVSGGIATLVFILAMITSSCIGTCKCGGDGMKDKKEMSNAYMAKQNTYNPTHVHEDEVYK